jgi:hypothetical protein
MSGIALEPVPTRISVIVTRDRADVKSHFSVPSLTWSPRARWHEPRVPGSGRIDPIDMLTEWARANREAELDARDADPEPAARSDAGPY